MKKTKHYYSVQSETFSKRSGECRKHLESWV